MKYKPRLTKLQKLKNKKQGYQILNLMNRIPTQKEYLSELIILRRVKLVFVRVFFSRFVI